MSSDQLDYEEPTAAATSSSSSSASASAAAASGIKGFMGTSTSTFKDLHLKPEILRALEECGFEAPSEIQHDCLPTALMGTDVVCQAKAGMGKTAVFSLAILQQLKVVDGQVSAIVVAHTRELAYQIAKEFRRFAKYLPEVRVSYYYGGTQRTENEQDLRDTKPNIVVATPGRLKDLVNNGSLDVKNVKFFVVDECDRVMSALDMRQDVQTVFFRTPVAKQVFMVTATLPAETLAVVTKFMRKPLVVSVDEEKLTLHGLSQFTVQLTEAEKIRKLTTILDDVAFNQAIIFVKNGSRAAALSEQLERHGFPSKAIYSERRRGAMAEMTQQRRIELFDMFKRGEFRVLVATDLMGRGVDIEHVNLVINFDFPEIADTYMHRVGRAGRGGTIGVAVSFVTSDEDAKILAEVQSRFHAKMQELPAVIDKSLYMRS